MLGSLPEADDAVQDAWLRLSRAGADEVENLGGWLTTVVARVCLNMLRSRSRRREEPWACTCPIRWSARDGERDPEDEAVLADSVGLALLVVLDTLAPAERLAFVLHDMFDAAVRGDRPDGRADPGGGAAARQPGTPPGEGRRGTGADPDLARQREVVDAFFAAARGGDFDALVAVLDPDVVLRIDVGTRRPAPPW